MRITFSSDSELIIDTIDRYAKSYGISRLKVTSDLFDSISPVLDYLVFQSSLKSEAEIKLLGLFAYELKGAEAKLAKGEVFFRYFSQNIKKLSYVVISKGTIRFSLPDRKHWPDPRELSQGRVNKMLGIYRPCGNSHYVCVLYPDRLKVGTYTSTITNFRSLAVNNYFFDINSLCFVGEEDFFYYDTNEYMKRSLRNKNQLHLPWVPFREIDDGYLFMATVHRGNLEYAVRKEGGFTVNFPYGIWKQ